MAYLVTCFASSYNVREAIALEQCNEPELSLWYNYLLVACCSSRFFSYFGISIITQVHHIPEFFIFDPCESNVRDVISNAASAISPECRPLLLYGRSARRFVKRGLGHNRVWYHHPSIYVAVWETKFRKIRWVSSLISTPLPNLWAKKISILCFAVFFLLKRATWK